MTQIDALLADAELETLTLNLNISDSLVVKYLAHFDTARQEEKALEALKIGVIAIQSAAPSLDSRVVEEKFREVETTIDQWLTGFQDRTKNILDDYFKPESGSLERSMNTVFGERGQLSQELELYFHKERGVLASILQDHLGSTSPFAISLDPNHKESFLSRIETLVKKDLEDTKGQIVNEFSLDTEDSALTRLAALLTKKIDVIQESNTTLFGEIRAALGLKALSEAETEKGTEKGRTFESDLYDVVAETGRNLGDATEDVTGQAGKNSRSKTGDYVITLGETCSAAGDRIVVEAKKEKGYKLKKAVDELKDAKANRDAKAGIFAFAKGYEPTEMGDFYRMGHDFYVTVDEDALANHHPLPFVDASYKIIRAMLVTENRKAQNEEIDVDRIGVELDYIVQQMKLLSEMSTKARTIETNAKFIVSTTNQLETDITSKINSIQTLIGRTRQPGPSLETKTGQPSEDLPF